VRRIRVGEPEYNEVMDFLIEEARLLDIGMLDEWLELTAQDLSYTMPIRRTTMRHQGLGFDESMAHFDDDRASMEFRIKRITRSGNAYADDPPSRTRRLVTNLRVHETASPKEFEVTSTLLLLRSRWDAPNFDFISCSREDLLRRSGDAFEIARRKILVDQASLGTPNLAVLL
jgi:3-phenylpropionate/cinnamic acid dioxygenase small subunit